MSFVAPRYLVTQFKPVQQKSTANKYTDAETTTDWWKVGMRHGFFPDIYIDLYFESNAQASHYALWQLVQPKDLIDDMGREPFVTEEVVKFRTPPQREQYRRQPEFLWKVNFRGGYGSRRVSLFMPNEAEARRYKYGQAYTGQNLFGTLPSVPEHSVSPLEGLADINREKELLRQQEEAAIQERKNQSAMAELTANTFWGQMVWVDTRTGAIIAQPATVQPYHKFMERRFVDDYQQGLERYVPPTTTPPPPKTTTPSTSFTGFVRLISDDVEGGYNFAFSPSTVPVFRNYTITSGGAAGYYIPPGAPKRTRTLATTGSLYQGYTEFTNVQEYYYLAGTFVPANGQWFGAYSTG